MKAMEHLKLDPEAGIQVDYWSNMTQSFILCGHFYPEDSTYIAEDELIEILGRSCIIFRFSNCTGNLINFVDSKKASEEDISRAHIALSIDESFKKQRRRSVF